MIIRATKEMMRADTYVKTHVTSKDEYRHAYAVAQAFRQEPRVYIVALLHDMAEDGHATAQELKELFGLDYDQVTALTALTRNHGEEYFGYIMRAKACPMACRIKLSDVMHNILRCALAIRNNPKEKAERLERYVRACKLLC